jgi:hypothetical protein
MITSAQRHKCACGDQPLHHIFVAIIESIGHVFGRCRDEWVYRFVMTAPVFSMRVYARQWSRPVLSGSSNKGPMSTSPSAHWRRTS